MTSSSLDVVRDLEVHQYYRLMLAPGHRHGRSWTLAAEIGTIQLMIKYIFLLSVFLFDFWSGIETSF